MANKSTKNRSVLDEDVSLYWAYGSNLNMAGMARRCPKAEPYKKLYVPNGQLVFRGIADVVGTHDKSKMVAGALWKVTPNCIKALDAYEGVASKLYSKKYLLISINGKPKPVLFYKMEQEDGIMPPWDAYYDTILQGYKDFGLDERFLIDAALRSEKKERRTPTLKARYERKGRPVISQRKSNGG